jgi:uncharacterized protein YuzE
MRVTYDKSADAAYIYIKENVAPGEAVHTLPYSEKVMINIDFDKDMKLLGIEVLGASLHLPNEVLGNAERLDSND